MEFVPFYTLFPELGKRETRSVTVLNHPFLPDDEYGLVELFCNKPGCDCRRVMFSIYPRSDFSKLLAVVAYGWESEQFYADWIGSDNPRIILALQGPDLNPGSPQSPLAPALLMLVKGLLLDEAYVDRIKRHYRMFKAAIRLQFGQKGRGKSRRRIRPSQKRKK